MKKKTSGAKERFKKLLEEMDKESEKRKTPRERAPKVIKASPNVSRKEDKTILPEQLASAEKRRERWANDLPLFAKECLTVMDRDHPSGAAIVPLIFQPSQLHIHKTIEAIEQFNLDYSAAQQRLGVDMPVSKLPVETVVLKARKVMASTYFRARAFQKNEFQKGHYDLVMAHEKEVAVNLAEMIQRFHRGWVDVDGDRSKISRMNDILVEWDHDSRTIVKTAGSRSHGASQGFTYHYLHLSEISRYADGTSELASATTAAAKFREVHLESTARGANEFKRQWDHAMELAEIIALFRAGEPFPRSWNKKFRIFWAWWQDDGYRIALNDQQREYVLRTLDGIEVGLMDKFQLDPEQIQWRRDKIANECSQQREMAPDAFFRQEYPSDPVEAFISKGMNMFDREAIHELGAGSAAIVKAFENRTTFNEMPAFVGNLLRDKLAPEGFRQVKASSFLGANFVVFEPPLPNNAYVIGADSAEGLEHSDDSVAVIYNRGLGLHAHEAARYIGKASGKELAAIVFYLHKLYNDAYVVAERNNGSGAVMCTQLVELGCYAMYHHKDPEEFADREEPDSFTAGFSTNPKTKKFLAETLNFCLRERSWIVRHPDALSQLEVYHTDEKGKLRAPHGLKDDCVSADMLACYGHQPDVGPPVWAGRRAPEDEEYDKLTEEQKLKKHYDGRIQALLKSCQDRNREQESRLNMARRIVDRGVIGD